MKTLSEYCKDNILVIPQALYSMTDAHCLLNQGEQGIFYKCLKKDLLDVEFYTNMPCFVYIENGVEVITNSDNKRHHLTEDTVVFLPQGQNLHSDFVHSTDSLKAYLIFIDDEIISEYLKNKKSRLTNTKEYKELYKVKCGPMFKSFFDSVKMMSKEKEGISSTIKGDLLKLKLLEFLHLLAAIDESALNARLSNRNNTLRPKRNIIRLLEESDLLKLSLDDLSNLSGRSLSSFNRDFKAIYNMPPKRWLQDKRLTHARNLLIDRDLSVTDVAVEIGYDNVSHFIKLFKEKYKITPKQLKQTIE